MCHGQGVIRQEHQRGTSVGTTPVTPTAAAATAVSAAVAAACALHCSIGLSACELDFHPATPAREWSKGTGAAAAAASVHSRRVLRGSGHFCVAITPATAAGEESEGTVTSATATATTASPSMAAAAVL